VRSGSGIGQVRCRLAVWGRHAGDLLWPLLRPRASFGCWLALLLVATRLGAQTDWLQFDFDARHTGVNPFETQITSANVGDLRVLFNVTLPDVADGAPAYLSGVSTASGTRDLLFLTTRDGRLLALDALSGATVWVQQPANAPRYTTSSPAIDPNRQFVYSYGLDGRVHKYQVADGSEVTSGGWPELTTLKPQVEKGSSALSIATRPDGTATLYVANGGYLGDAGDYQGHVTAIALASGSQAVFNADCSDQVVHFTTGGSPDCPQVQSAVWSRPGVVYDAELDRILFATGNGLFDAMAGRHDWGDSVLALRPDGSSDNGEPLDAYTPSNFAFLDHTDSDLGSMAPVLLPSPAAGSFPHLAVQGGKDGHLRLLNLDNLSGHGGPGHIGGELQDLLVPQRGEVLPQPATWTNPADGSSWLFVANAAGISGLQLVVQASGMPAGARRQVAAPRPSPTACSSTSAAPAFGRSTRSTAPLCGMTAPRLGSTGRARSSSTVGSM
jgi:outer membrane protein assembly factor BamB